MKKNKLYSEFTSRNEENPNHYSAEAQEKMFRPISRLLTVVFVVISILILILISGTIYFLTK